MLLAAATAVPAGAATCGRAAAIRTRSWFVATPPLPPHSAAHQPLHGSAARLRTMALDPADPRVVLASDGVRVQRSDDGGCAWKQVYALPDPPGATTPDGTVGEILSIDVTRVAGKTRVLLAVQGTGWDIPATARTVIVRSDDGYNGWTAVTDPQFAGVYDATAGAWKPVVRGAGAVAYAAVPSATGAVAYLRSVDGGKTWALRSSPADLKAPVAILGFAVNPWDTDEVWEWGGHWSRGGDPMTGLRRSTDGGATWTSFDPWPAYATKPLWQSADVAWPRKGGPARVVVLGDAAAGNDVAAPILAWSGDAGATFHLAVPPSRDVSLYDAAVAHLANGDAVIVAGNRLAYRVRHTGRPPRRGDWLKLAKSPEEPPVTVLGYGFARGSATTPGVVAVPTLRTVQLLTVAR